MKIQMHSLANREVESFQEKGLVAKWGCVYKEVRRLGCWWCHPGCSVSWENVKDLTSNSIPEDTKVHMHSGHFNKLNDTLLICY